MLTKDRISLRVTLTALRRIVDPERAVAALADVDGWLYRLVQFAIARRGVAHARRVLSAKSVLDGGASRPCGRADCGERHRGDGVGVKDVILPGEIRELVNKVVEAERVAKATDPPPGGDRGNARRSLTTPRRWRTLLLRLRSFESLERLVEKVGRIDLHAGDGQGLDALLPTLSCA